MANRYVNQRITADIVPMDESEDPDEGPMFQVPLLKRNLLGDFGRPSIIEPPISEHMKVFLRIRPFSEEETHKKENQGCLTIESDRTVVTHAPKESNYYKNSVRGYGKTTTKFTFSHIFGQNTTQKEFFNDTMLGLVKDFIDGQNCLVFSYGVTSSGKTYTIQGLPKDAGVLPRALDVLFNSINGRQWQGMNLKPEMFTNVTRLTPEQELVEQKIKERVMKLSCTDDVDVMSLLGDDASDVSIATNTTTCSESSNVSTMDNKDSLDGGALFEELNDRVREEAMVSVETQGQIKFSVWVSFAEIYNEQIYDLLESLPKKKNARRTCLKVSDDQNGSPYIKGLKYINVNSADEAYKLLTIGQRNLKTACTKLNHNSSRSHCIFNIKILRLVDKEDPNVARVSTLTLCDLAGSERYGKTQNTGERLKEAGNINTSLLTLGRCIETLKYNQTHKDHTRIIPFRESKLTRLFQNYFVGRGKAAMFVNVNQCASMFDETQHVFKFSAIASQVVVQQKPVFFKPKLPQIVASPNPIPRASISWATPARIKVPRQQDAENVPLPDEDDDDEDLDGASTYTQQNIDELLGIIEQLQGSLEQEMRSKAKLESQIRKEVCEEMMKQFIEIEEQCGEQIRIREQMAEELAEKRMQILIEAERAKRRKGETMTDEDDEWVSSVTLHQEKVKVEQRDDTIKNQENEIETLNKKLSEMSDNQDKLQKEKQNLQKQLKDSEAKITSVDSVDNKLTTDLEELRKTITEYEGKVEKLEKELSQKTVVTEDAGKADLIENLSQQITQTRQQVKEQETEIRELNDMLTEAGETFQQKETEINKLAELVQEYEKKLETQCEAVIVLERAASDSKVAMETADQSLSKREDCVTSLQTDIRNLEGTQSIDYVPESPVKNISLNTPRGNMSSLDQFRSSVSGLDLSALDKVTNYVVKPSSHKLVDYHADSSGVVADCESEDCSDTEVFFKNKKNVLTSKNNIAIQRKNGSTGYSEENSLEYSGSDVSEVFESPVSPKIQNQDLQVPKTFNFQVPTQLHNSNHFQFHKPLNDSRVLQVVLSPLKSKFLVKHTKSSMLRLKNSPSKDPTRGRECLKKVKRSINLDKENKFDGKRKCEDSENDADDTLNTSKRRKVVASKPKTQSKTKPTATSKMGQKYNLRTRR